MDGGEYRRLRSGSRNLARRKREQTTKREEQEEEEESASEESSEEESASSEESSVESERVGNATASRAGRVRTYFVITLTTWVIQLPVVQLPYLYTSRRRAPCSRRGRPCSRRSKCSRRYRCTFTREDNTANSHHNHLYNSLYLQGTTSRGTTIMDSLTRDRDNRDTRDSRGHII